MWPFKRAPADPEADRPTRERLDNLEDDVKHLNRRFTRLQQQVTRWAVEYDEDTFDEDDEFTELLTKKRRQNAEG